MNITAPFLTVLCLVCCTLPARAQEPTYVGDFSLTDRSGRTVTAADLRGKVWVASFVFTRCTGGCPQVTQTMQQLQRAFAYIPGVRLVTFTIDPERDNLNELNEYANHFGADSDRWLFLRGSEAEIDALVRRFNLYARKVPSADLGPTHLLAQAFGAQSSGPAGPMAPLMQLLLASSAMKSDAFTVSAEVGRDIDHTFKLVLVDRDGRIVNYFDGKPDERMSSGGTDPYFNDGLRRLEMQVAALSPFPPLNAALNALAGALILFGYTAVRQRWLRLHAVLMVTAIVVSTLFLASYLYYHFLIRHAQPMPFSHEAPTSVRYLYYGILTSHTVLAIVVAPLVLFTAWQGWRGRLARHVRVARWTMPLWMYVSLTGVAVYWMLYRMYPPF